MNEGFPAPPSSLVGQLRLVPLFAGLSKSRLELLAAAARPRVFRLHEPLCRQGQPGDGLFVLLEGSVRISVATPAGDALAVARREAVSVIGELSILDGRPRSATVEAETLCRVLALSRVDFQPILQSCADVALALLEATSLRLRQATDRLAVISHLSVRSRLAHWLMELAIRDGELRGIEIRLPATDLDTLSAQVGARPETVARTLQYLRSRGWIRQEEGRLVVVDVQGLRAQADAGLEGERA